MSLFNYLGSEKKVRWVSPFWIKNEVDCNFFSFSFPVFQQDLQDSIKEFGLLHPLIIREKNFSKKHILLAGHRRWVALKNLSSEEQEQSLRIPIIAIPEKEISLSHTLKMMVSENTTLRTLNLVERARILFLCLYRLKIPQEEVIRHWLPLLGLESNRKILYAHLMILKLPRVCLEYVLDHKFSLKTALNLAKIPQDALEILFPIMTRFSMGVNRLEEILQNLNMIANRKNVSAADVLEEILVSKNIAQQLMTPTKNLPHFQKDQRLEIFRKALHQMAHPHLSEMEEQFQKNKKALQLPANITLSPPHYFEGSRFDVKFQFGNRNELKATAQKLLDSVELSEIDNLLNLL